jgi:RHS repeat-associated protein
MAAMRRYALGFGFVVLALAVWVTQQHAQSAPAGAARGPAHRFTGGRPDSALVWGPTTCTSTSATTWTPVGGTMTVPSFNAAKRYFVRITNGDTVSGANRVSQVSLTINGQEFMSSSDLTTTISAVNKVIQLTQVQSTFQLSVIGPVGSFVKARIYETSDPSYSFHSEWFDITVPRGLNITTDAFGKPANASGPWTVRVVNGDPSGDGTGACSNLKVTLNGTDVIPLGLVNTTNLTAVRQVTLQNSNTVTIRLYGTSGYANVYWTATDTTPPTVNVVRPIEAYVTDSSSVATTVTLSDQTPPMTMSVTGLSTFSSSSGFTKAVPLPIDGLYTLSISATDRAGYTTTVTRHVIRDTQAPVLFVGTPPATPPTTTSDSILVSGAWSDTSITTLTVDGDLMAPPDSSGTFSRKVGLDLGPNGILVRATDATGHVTQTKRYVYRQSADEPAPRDSSQINLTQLDNTETSPFRSQVRFIYLGTSAYQTGNDTTALTAGHEAVVRGRVLARDFGVLPGVSVRVLNHPEYGESVTRADGSYSLVVNGGAPLVVRFVKSGFLESQRQIEVPTQDYALLDDIAMIGRSGRSYQVDNDSLRAITGRFESDANGDRRLWMLVQQGTIATVTPSGGSPINYGSFRIRLKEFTVGSSGGESMPGTLPASTAYTYCVGVSLVEADSILGAQPLGTLSPEITFDRPIITYTREFLGMRVGNAVPCGVYDSQLGKWVPRPDGWVVQILPPADGLATLDTNGDGIADAQSRYDSLGISTAERAKLVTLFAPGDSLLRVPVDHFSALDYNYNEAALATAATSNAANAGPASSVVDDPNCTQGCIIETENRVLGETIPLRGVPYSLHYRSNRQPGDRAMRWIRVPLVGAMKPEGLRRVHLQIDVAGRRFTFVFDGPSLPTNDVYVFREWDGKDAFGRTVNGSVTATLRIGYEFTGLYATSGSAGRGFGNAATVPATGGTPRSGDRSALRVLWSTQRVSVGTPSMASAGLGGWTITPHHFYDVNGRGTVYFGDGSIRIANRNYPIIQIFAGTGQGSGSFIVATENVPAIQVGISPVDLAFAPDGSLYLIDGGKARVVHITKDGLYHLVAGTVAGGAGPLGTDGAPAIGQGLQEPHGVTVAPDGNVYFTDTGLGHQGVFKVTPDGKLFRVAGTLSGTNGLDTEDVAATARLLPEPVAVAVGPDGSLFVGDIDRHRVFRVGTDGMIRTYAGNGVSPSGEVSTEGRAIDIPLNDANDLAVDRDGNLYIAEQGNDRIRRVSPDGRMTTVKVMTGDGPQFVDVAPDGGVYVYTSRTRGVARIEPDGTLTSLAGGYSANAPQDWIGQNLGFARAATFGSPGGLAFGPDGAVYTGETSASGSGNGIRRILPDVPGAVLGEIAFPSEDGRQVFFFSSAGRHLRTVDAATGVTLCSFGYQGGHLHTITDANSNVTTIERDASGKPIKIIGPYQAENLLTVTGDYLTEVSNAATSPAETYSLTYYPSDPGLLSTFRNPRSLTQTFTYKLGSSDQDDGRLAEDLDPALGNQTFTLDDGGVVRRVTRNSPEHRVTQYEVTEMLDGLRRRYITRSDLSRSYVADSLNLNPADPPLGERILEIGPAGDSTITTPARDARYGMLAKIPGTVTTRLPSGLARSVTSTREYGTNGVRTETVSFNENAFTSAYDSLQRTLTTTTPEHRTTTVVLDNAGRPTGVQIGSLAAIGLTYSTDGRGRLERLEQGGRGWRYHYDALGRVDLVRDTLGQATRYVYDGADRVIAQQLPGGREVDYTYDGNGNLTGLTPPGRPQHRFDYTPVNLNETYTPPAVSGIADPATRYEFNLDRQLKRVTRPDGGVVDLAYETGTGRLSSVAQPRGVNQYSYWDTPQPRTSWLSGQVKTVSSADSVFCDYAYDGPLLTSETWRGRVVGSVQRTYDNAFRLKTEQVAGTAAVTYGYDADGLVSSVTGSGWTLNVARQATTGLLAGTSVGSGAGQVASTQNYDSHGELAALDYTLGGAPYYHEILVRDSLGRVTRIDETLAGVSTSRTFGYTAAGWLASVGTGTSATSRGYEYDGNATGGNGNRTAERDGSGALLASASYDAQDRMLSYGGTNYTYTAAGELATRIGATEALSTTYDALGNLISAGLGVPSGGGTTGGITVGTVITYRVDGQNRRVQKLVNDFPVEGWLYRNSLSPVAELDGTGTVLNRYVYATFDHAPDLVLRGNATYRVIRDHLGSVRAVVNLATGEVAQRLDYDAWGNLTLDTAPAFQSLGYAGGIQDRDTRLVRFGARDFEPTTGRWTCKDALGFVSADGSNLYAYANGVPTTLIDPDGSSSIPPSPGWNTPNGPSGYDLAADICEARRHRGDFLWLYNNFKDYSKGDPKRKGKHFEDYGNWRFGVIASAAGFPSLAQDIGAGIYQARDGRTRPDWLWPFPDVIIPFLLPPFGDDPHDQVMIGLGQVYYAQIANGVRCDCK